MAILKRGKGGTANGGGDLRTVLAEGQDMIEQVSAFHSERWGLGSADSWDIDQTAGVITWMFEDGTAEAPLQFLGTFNPTAGSWLWAWANESVVPNLRTDAERVKAWAKAHGHANLLLPKIEADEEAASTLAAIAFRVTEATGFYRANAGPSTVFVTFGPVTVRTDTGATKTFRIAIGS